MAVQDPSGARDDAAGGAPAAIVDLLIVGGGINGAGIARDAAGRGLSVLLCEKDDLAEGTSSRSSRLIHGGLRYLEYGELRLVREALREREILLGIAPHLVRPLRFVLPHVPQMRPAWMLRAGLFLYDHLAPRDRLGASQSVRLDQVPEGAAVRPHIRRAFLYSDCRTDDARLVVANALAAHESGARIRTRVELLRAERVAGGLWHAQLHDRRSGARWVQAARVLVNAGGPWVEAIGARVAAVRPKRHALLVKGSHIVVSKFWAGDHAFLLQNDDRRVVFATPYEQGYAMLGTTDLPYREAPEQAAICAAEIDYLCAAANRQLRCQLGAADVHHAFAGVRALVQDEHDNPSAVTRDYLIDIEPAGAAKDARGDAPYVTILGGKITTYRRLAEHLLDLLQPVFPAQSGAWTGTLPLPGGELPEGDLAASQDAFERDFSFLPAEHARGLFARHGSRARRILADARGADDLGRHFGAGFYEREAAYLMQVEWARSADDLLWRRTKFGLWLTPAQRATLATWLDQHGAA
jgi:glycerol-3-phosphate dehydrogenase